MSSEDDTYSTMFTALKHPIRRKILRILNQTPATYTDILTQLKIDNGLLNYHLENMKDLITKNNEGIYYLSEFGKAAVGLTEKVEEAPERRKPIAGRLSPRQLIGVFLFLIIGLASVSTLFALFYNDYQKQSSILAQKNTQLDDANQRIKTLSIFAELANISQPATIWTYGTQMVSAYPVSYTYIKKTDSFAEGNQRNSIIAFYVPVDGSVAHIMLAVDPVNVYELELTIQRGVAWKNETWLKVGTTLNTSINKWQSPILWSVKTRGNGAYETPILSRGWYTFNPFGPFTVFEYDNKVQGYDDRLPSFFTGSDPRAITMIDSYTVWITFTVMKDGKSMFFAVTSDRP